MLNYYYGDTISSFLSSSTEEIIGTLTLQNRFDSTREQNYAWEGQIAILKEALVDLDGEVYFEFSIPRMGKRVDVLALIKGVVFVIEFKVGAKEYHGHDLDQTWDYALDLKNFHGPSHTTPIIPILVATKAKEAYIELIDSTQQDLTLEPIRVNAENLRKTIQACLVYFADSTSDLNKYVEGSYSPTPTIIEAALSLYRSHRVEEITRSDAAAKNLDRTANYVLQCIREARQKSEKVICFVTGVPGAGKTLVGLRVATQRHDELEEEYNEEAETNSVYLSGNGPLVAILQEALTRDRVERAKEEGKKITKKEAKGEVKAFVQNVHHYRDEYLRDKTAPFDHVAIFDEAQRAWNKEMTVDFMKRKKNQPNFDFSEPEFLISCLDRHEDWAVVVCLVGGGQEINRGEAGISEWLRGVRHSFPHWKVAISPNLKDREYDALDAIRNLENITEVRLNSDLHLSVSMRSFRAEHLSTLVKELLDLKISEAQASLDKLRKKYPIVLTRDLAKAKRWLKEQARGTERYGLVVSSQAQRLKPLAIDVKTPLNPIHWFLNDKRDVRSSYYLEDVATEFQIQGLELDWVGIVWDGDLRFGKDGWETYSFRGNKWQNINKEERKLYLINAYRVLLTRARQGMVIVVPEGNPDDHTRNAKFYDGTFHYLKEIGFNLLP